VSQEPNTKDAANADWFPKAFKLFGIDRRDQTFDEFDGFVDGSCCSLFAGSPEIA